MLTVGSLVEGLGLELAAGHPAAATPVRWVHITELPDPTPWLSGGELLLTTGLQLKGDDDLRAFVRRLEKHGLAGLGFGTGFEHDELPAALRDEATRLGFPLFEVPYDVPFIALTERAMTRLVNEQYEVLQRGIAIHKRLERLVLEGSGLGAVVQAVAEAIGGAACVLGPRGERMAAAKTFRPFPPAALAQVAEEVQRRSPPVTFAPDHEELGGRALALPVAGGEHAWLVAVRDGGPLGPFERLLLQQAVTVVALELMRQRVMRDTERRLAGDVFAEALSGRLDQAELETRLAPLGVAGEAFVIVMGGIGEPAGAEHALELALSDAGVQGGLVATRGELLCAVVSAAEDLDPIELAARARGALAKRFAGVRAAVSRPSEVKELKRAFHEARCALEAASMADGRAPEVASYRDLGAFQLILSLQDDEALRLYCDSLLGPLENGAGGGGSTDYGDELLRSLEAFIEQNGQWERAARELYCHRHTLRYRIRRIEELTGRDLGRARDRIEFWLALRARELLA